MAQFEFKLEKPNETFPAGPAGFRRGQPQGEPWRHPGHQPGSPHAPGHPKATGGRRRHPCRRGPKAIKRSRMRAAAHQASLAAARCTASTTAIPMPPPPPPTGPTTTRLIKVVTRRASLQSSFSQLDGQDSSVDESDCSATVADEKDPLIATSASLQSPPPPPPPSTRTHQRPEVKAAVRVKEAPAVNTPDRHPRPLQRAR